MMQNAERKMVRPTLLMFFLALFLLATPGKSAEATNSVSDGSSQTTDTMNDNQSLRSYLQIQEQLHATQLAIEKNRQETEAEAAHNAETLENRLGRMEKSFSTQRFDQLKDLQHQDHLILITAGGFAGFGFLVLLSALFLQYYAVNRLTAIAQKFNRPGAGVNDSPLLTGQTWEQSTGRFLTLLEQLEKRMSRMEGAAGQLTNGAGPEGQSPNHDIDFGLQLPLSLPHDESTISLLLSKGQALLKLDKAEAALGCMEEVLAIDPNNTDALVKKGAALERLQRLEEAVQCYDRAIAEDNSMTMAYLYKGGVYNRMERYTEALECYEQALKTRQKGHAANVIMD